MQNYLIKKLNIKLSKRKSIGLYVTPKGVEVRAPIGTSKVFIDQFVASKSAWIEKQFQMVQSKNKEVYQLDHGQLIPILGQLKQVSIQTGVKNQVQETDSEIHIFVTRKDKQRIEKTFARFLSEKAKLIIPELVYEIAPLLKLEHKIQGIKFRRTKTKWGHCTHDGRLQFNWLIMMAPPKIIRSLVCHEICHLKHLNHSTEFWDLVKTIDPDYLLSKHWLKVHGHKLSMFE